ncbi:MAG: sphingomyelin phosphodiesterase [Bacteroidetes bacterium]|nr:sphingomyelin phosphodiesterase [Bacteroidota bacterium]
MRGLLGSILLAVSLSCMAGSADSIPTGKNELHILTYNVKFLPAILVSQHHHPIKRAKYIPQALIADTVDVIVFEEAFDATARLRLIRGLKKEFPYITGPANKKASFKYCSGVFMASRYPMRELDEVQYKECISYDCMARKGGLISEVTLPGGRQIQIIGTHIQAPGEDSIKIHQLYQLRRMMDKYKRANVPQLACGDFNACRADKPLYDTLIHILGGLDGPICGDQQCSSDHQHNDMEHYGPDQNLVDYLLYCHAQPPLFTERRIIKYQYQWSKKHKDLSDHYGVRLKLIF